MLSPNRNFRLVSWKILPLSIVTILVLGGISGCQALIADSLVALGKEELAITSIGKLQKKKVAELFMSAGKLYIDRLF